MVRPSRRRLSAAPQDEEKSRRASTDDADTGAPHPEERSKSASRRVSGGPSFETPAAQAPQGEAEGGGAKVMLAANIEVTETPLVLYTLRRADDALILGHRLSEWCGHAPMLEEDMALANMGLDLLGQARELYAYAAKIEGKGNDEDKFAYLRDVRQYRNLLLVEQPNGDFAHTIVRQCFYAAFADLYWRATMTSSDATLAAIAAKSEKESAYHLRHSSEWMIRLGDGTAESHARTQAAIDDLWAFTGEMFEVDDSERELIKSGTAIDPAPLRAQWLKTVSGILTEATLSQPNTEWMQQGGRSGRHSEHLGHLLSELQSMQRTFPGASW
jgi:ring-1,2-phenylacetyl-CoA epoxidase subunit PaaC